MNATTSEPGGLQPGVARGTVAPPSGRHDQRAVVPGDPADPSVEPLSTTIGRAHGGIRDSTHGRASASSRQGSTTSTTSTGPVSSPSSCAMLRR